MYGKFFKRPLDAIAALILFVLFSWLFLFIIAVYILTLQFPVFFRQERIGKDEKPFILYKFRTLKNTNDELSERKFFPGNIMRYASLDELPQLWNVLKGEMSLIGPRPLPIGYLSLFTEDQRVRHTIRPGITGWAQVNGRHGIPWPEKFRLDIFYVRNISFGLDLMIFLKTIQLLTSFQRDKSLVEEPFNGER